MQWLKHVLLLSASVGGNRDVALALLMAGADINAQDKDGKTALMIAIINGHQPLVELLLKRNANMGVKNEVICCHSVSRLLVVNIFNRHQLLIGMSWRQREYEPHREKTGFLHMGKQRRRSASR